MVQTVKQSKWLVVVGLALVIFVISAAFIVPQASAQTESNSSESASASAASASASAASAQSSSAAKPDSPVLRMKTLAEEVAKLQNSYKTIEEGDSEAYMAIVEKGRTYYVDEFYSQAAPWFTEAGTWRFSGTRVVNDDLYQALWTCVDEEGNTLALAKAVYLDGQSKFTDATHLDTIYGAQKRPVTEGDVDANLKQASAGIQNLMDQIKALHGDEPAPERESKYGNEEDTTGATADEIDAHLREAAESEQTKDWFRQHGVDVDQHIKVRDAYG